MQLAVGRIGKPHGIRGDVTVDVRTDDPDIWFAPGAVLATDPAASGPLKVAASRWHSGRLLLRFEGHEGRDASEALRGIWLVIDSADVVTTDDPDDFHDQQLLGLPVVTVAGEEIGTITDILHRAQSLLVVQTADGDKLVPFVTAIVPEVDLKAGRVVIDPPPGLFDVQ